MELLNATRMPAAYTMGMGPDAREHLVVVVKGTFLIPQPGGEPELAPEQLPLVMADEFTGEPGLSSVLRECDFALRKPRCDVLLNGSAHAPPGELATRVTVGLRVGTMTKTFDVVGDRVWQRGLLRPSAGPAQPFTRMPISYDRAFGGGDPLPKRPEQRKVRMENPVGVGYHPYASQAELAGRLLPNTEESGKPCTSTTGRYRPMSFGALGRQFAQRIRYAGTYDQKWLDEVFPFLPRDFDDRYNQAAPEEQQIEHPTGGEEVVLVSLTPEQRTSFALPAVPMPVEFTLRDGARSEVEATLDTILLEPDERRFSLVWRASLPLKRNMLEVRQAVVGRMSSGYYRAREAGKAHYRSLAELVGSGTES